MSDAIPASMPNVISKEAVPGNLQLFEDFAMEAWDLIRGPQCNINTKAYDFYNINDIHQALSDHGQAEAYLTELESLYRKNLLMFKSFDRDVENLFGIFFRRDFLPRSIKVSGMSQSMFEGMADEEFTAAYGFDRTKIRYVEDVYKELKKTFDQQHEYLKGIYWEIKDCTKLVEMAFNTQNSGVPRLTASRIESDGTPQAQMPRVRADSLPMPAPHPPQLPPEFRLQG